MQVTVAYSKELRAPELNRWPRILKGKGRAVNNGRFLQNLSLADQHLVIAAVIQPRSISFSRKVATITRSSVKISSQGTSLLKSFDRASRTMIKIISSMLTISEVNSPILCSIILITCSASPFPFNGLQMKVISQSSGNSSHRNSMLLAPTVFNISVIISDGPAALMPFMFLANQKYPDGGNSKCN